MHFQYISSVLSGPIQYWNSVIKTGILKSIFVLNIAQGYLLVQSHHGRHGKIQPNICFTKCLSVIEAWIIIEYLIFWYCYSNLRLIIENLHKGIWPGLNLRLSYACCHHCSDSVCALLWPQVFPSSCLSLLSPTV